MVEIRSVTIRIPDPSCFLGHGGCGIGMVGVASMLIAAGATVNPDSAANEHLPLFTAIVHNHPMVVSLLLEAHASKDTLIDYSRTKISIAKFVADRVTNPEIKELFAK